MCNSSRLKFGQQASTKRPGEAARTGEHGEHPLVEHPQVRRCPGHNIQREGRKISLFSGYSAQFPYRERTITNKKYVARAAPWGARGAASRTLIRRDHENS